MPKTEFVKLVSASQTYTEIMAYFGFGSYGNNYLTLKARLEKENIDHSHIANRPRNAGLTNLQKLPDCEVFCKNSTYTSGGALKIRLVNDHDWDLMCALCGLATFWNGKRLVLQLDHISGDRSDNRMSNLRFLCPNCHSQTLTFAGKNNRQQSAEPEDEPATNEKIRRLFTTPPKRKAKKYVVRKANRTPRLIPYKGRMVTAKEHQYYQGASKYPRPTSRKVLRPSLEHLELLVWQKPTMQIAKDYGVSDVAVGKWCKTYGIAKPPRGYWAKQLVVK